MGVGPGGVELEGMIPVDPPTYLTDMRLCEKVSRNNNKTITTTTTTTTASTMTTTLSQPQLFFLLSDQLTNSLIDLLTSINLSCDSGVCAYVGFLCVLRGGIPRPGAKSHAASVGPCLPAGRQSHHAGGLTYLLHSIMTTIFIYSIISPFDLS